MSCVPDLPQSDAFTAPIQIPSGRIELRAEVDYERLRFAYRTGRRRLELVARRVRRQRPFR